MKTIRATELKPGMVLLLPFGKTATVQEVLIGREFVHFRTEKGKSRISKYDEVLVEEEKS